MSKHRVKSALSPDESPLRHIQEARPDFVRELQSLKDEPMGGVYLHSIASTIRPEDVMPTARKFSGELGYTEGDLKLLSDALSAGSEKLRNTSIGLKTGAFIARFLVHMERRLGRRIVSSQPTSAASAFRAQFTGGRIMLSVHQEVDAESAGYVNEILRYPGFYDVLGRACEYRNYQLSNLRKITLMPGEGEPEILPESNTLVIRGRNKNQVFSSMRSVLNQPPLEVTFQPSDIAQDFIRRGILPASIMDGLLDIPSWRDFSPDDYRGERSVLKAISLNEGFLALYQHVKSKAVVRKFVLQPGTEQHMAVDGRPHSHPDVDAEGKLFRQHYVSPEGGMRFVDAMHEIAMMEQAYRDGLTLDFPLGGGEYPTVHAGGEKTGYVQSLTPKGAKTPEERFMEYVERTLQRFDRGEMRAALEIRPFIDRFFARMGGKLRETHDKRYFLKIPTHDNLYETDDGRMWWTDFTLWEDMRGQSRERQIAMRSLDFVEFALHMQFLPFIRDENIQRRYVELFGMNPMRSICKGYFGNLYDPERHNITWDNVISIGVDGERTPVHMLDRDVVRLMSQLG